MVRLLDLPSSLALLLSATALASPLPQGPWPDDRLDADFFWDREPCTTHSTVETNSVVFGSGRARSTHVVYTTYATTVYTTHTDHTTRNGRFTTSTASRATTETVSVTPPGLAKTRVLSTTPPAAVNMSTTFLNSTTSMLSANTSMPVFLNTTMTLTTNTSAPVFAHAKTRHLTTTTAHAVDMSSISMARVTTRSTFMSGPPMTNRRRPSTVTTSASICGPSAFAPARTNEGTVEGCNWWYVAQPGDFCYTVAGRFDISVELFMAMNPSVLAPNCTHMMAGDAYCLRACGPLASSAVLASTTRAVKASSAALSLSSPTTTTVAAGASDALSSLSLRTTVAANASTTVLSLHNSTTTLAANASSTLLSFNVSATTSRASNVSSTLLSLRHPTSTTAAANASSTLLSLDLPTSTTNPSLGASASTLTTSTTPTAAAPTASVAYRSFNGDGTPADGWPTMSDWISFAAMFAANEPTMRTACQAWGVPDNSAAEIATLREEILSVGEATGVDPRFILAVVMQESTGCVRVITTAYSHANPGLMQSFNGTGSCNTNSAPLGLPGVAGDGDVQTPCPRAEIRQQILDGTNGTVWGPGLVQDLAQVGGDADGSRWYRAARLYNGGSVVDGDLALPCCTPSYASDVANRLVGWVTGPRTFVAQ